MIKTLIKKVMGISLLLAISSVPAFSDTKKYERVTEKTITEDGVMYPGYTFPYKWNSDIKGEPVLFDEVWGYVMISRLKDYDDMTPLTDVGLFAAEINSYGELTNVPKRTAVGKNFKGRVHLVTICESTSLSHFCIDPKYGARKKIVEGLLEACEEFDGLQVDWELIPSRDADNFLSFLKELKKGLGKKPLTVCVPARTKTLKQDVYSYEKIGKIADRIMVMAYDEHWTGGPAGSIASMDWCEKIADYAKTVWPANKYIFGLPFYGRIWGNKSVKQALAFNGMNRTAHENGVVTIERERGVPHYKYKVEVEVEGWYEDAYSNVERSRMYKQKGYNCIAFWRMGQEDVAVWEWIGNKTSGVGPLTEQIGILADEETKDK
ncbi:glycosyl hydrolase family 18 protein [Treponema sp.]|uniref:glycosyl hydrolase family 18 protein n=1 Tax=Treponema sp. TaxID=166 RepID=UPI00298DC9F1|nr:glycosyl hydrolase family 18 protein [Treponema sp.]